MGLSFIDSFTSTDEIFTRDNVLKGGSQDYAMIFVICAMFALLILLRASPNYKHGSKVYYGNLAWIRAYIFFGFCFLVSWSTGVLDAVIVRANLAEYVQDKTWQVFTAFNFVAIFVAYWIVWPIGTVTYNRKSFFLTTLLFGICNGLSESMLNLSIWAVLELLNKPRWCTFILYFLVTGGWKANWDTRYWNVYVTPEHNILSWNLIKVLSIHLPNVFISYTHLIMFEQPVIFVGTQTLALMGAVQFTAILPPWDTTWRNPEPQYLIKTLADKGKNILWDGQQWNGKTFDEESGMSGGEESLTASDYLVLPTSSGTATTTAT